MSSRSTPARQMTTKTGLNATAVLLLPLLLQSAITTIRAAAVDDGSHADLKRLAALADELRADMGRTVGVRARVRTAGAAGRAGCGFAFLVDDDARRSKHVPPLDRAECSVGGGARFAQRVQFVRPDATYEATVRAAAEDAVVQNVTFTSNGGDGLDVDTLCLGVGGGVDGAQAFCVDRRLLDACVGAAADDVFLGPGGGGGGGIRLSRAFAGRRAPSCKEIVFSDVGALARDFESLTRGPAADRDAAQQAVCSRVRLVPETSPWAYDAAKCYAQREGGAAAVGTYYVKMDAGLLRDGCTRTDDGGSTAANAFR